MDIQTTGTSSAPHPTHKPSSAEIARPDKLSVNGAVALTFAKAGIPVFPCRETGPRLKQPYTEHGHHDATAVELTVRAWWSRWPGALVGIPTGPGSGLWVLDVDGPAGHRSLAELLCRLGLETVRDLSRVVAQTPGRGWHVYFRFQPGERPRNRAKDIGPGLDTRGVKADGNPAGYVIAPGSTLPDGRSYRLIDPSPEAFGKAPATHISIPEALLDVLPAPRGLLYRATFNKAQRQRITADPELRAAIRDASAADWSGIFYAHWRAPLSNVPSSAYDAPAMRLQALHDLRNEADSLASLNDGRRDAIFTTAARLAKYVANAVLTAAEVQDALGLSWNACGGAAKHGRAFAEGAISRALQFGCNDPLPTLARQFRSAAAANLGARHG